MIHINELNILKLKLPYLQSGLTVISCCMKELGRGGETCFLHSKLLHGTCKFRAVNTELVEGSNTGWSPSLSTQVKVNVDASFHLAPKKASSGVVIRDYMREILRACCRITWPVTTVFRVEARVVLHGLSFTTEMGFNKEILEGDSRTFVDKINSDREDLSEVSALI